jgi:hypothetical protein
MARAILARQTVAEDRNSTNRSGESSWFHDSFDRRHRRSISAPEHLYSQPNRDEYDPEHDQQAQHINFLLINSLEIDARSFSLRHCRRCAPKRR